MKLRIGELAERLGLNPRTIRYYESIGLLPRAERTPSGYRLYGETDEERLRFIRAAQGIGLALDEIKEVLDFKDRDELPCPYVLGLVAKRPRSGPKDRRASRAACAAQGSAPAGEPNSARRAGGEGAHLPHHRGPFAASPLKYPAF